MRAVIHHLSPQLLTQADTFKRSAQAKAQAGGNEAELEKACRGFESLFVNYLMQQMRDSVLPSGFMGGGPAEKIYTAMLDGEVSKTIAQQRGIGLARIMYEQMTADDRQGTIKNKVR